MPGVEARARAIRRRRRILRCAAVGIAAAAAGTGAAALASTKSRPVTVAAASGPRPPATPHSSPARSDGSALAVTAQTTLPASTTISAGRPGGAPGGTSSPPVTAVSVGGPSQVAVPGVPGLGSPGPAECSLSSGLSVAAGPHVVSGDHNGFPVVFTNGGGSNCVILGFARVVALGSSGTPPQTAELTPNGTLGGLSPSATIPPIVVLAPGQSASVLVEGTSGASCPSYAGLAVTAPNDDTAREVSLSPPMQSCTQIQTHPVVAGTTGSN